MKYEEIETDNPNVKIYRPVLSEEERLKREQEFAKVLGNILDCEVTFKKKNSK